MRSQKNLSKIARRRRKFLKIKQFSVVWQLCRLVRTWVTTFVSTKKQGKFGVKNRAKTGHFSKIANNFHEKSTKNRAKTEQKSKKAGQKQGTLKGYLFNGQNHFSLIKHKNYSQFQPKNNRQVIKTTNYRLGG